MIVLDTSVLVYAVGEPHPLQKPARDVIDWITNGRVQATTTTEVLQEFTHVRSRRRGRDDAAAFAREYATLLSPITAAEASDVAAGLDLFVEHERLGAFDCVLAAVTRRLSYTLLSPDKGFHGVQGLDHVDLAARDLIDEFGVG